MKRTLMLIFASLVLTGCTEAEEPVEVEAVEDEVVEVVEEEVSEVVENEPVVEDVEPVEDELTRDQTIRVVELMMAESFESGDVEYSIIHDALVYTPTDPGFSNEMAQMVLGLMGRGDWDGLVENFRELSGVISEMVDEDLGIVIMNPDNEERVILIVRNGAVEYDFMEDNQ